MTAPTTRTLESVIGQYPSMLVAFSGGVDSALLAVQARHTLGHDRTLAVLGISPSLATAQRAQAEQVAERFDFAFATIDTYELASPDYVENTPNRCYFCKHELWGRLTALARAKGLAVVADGTNADDLGTHRPGLAAAAAFDVVSPLADAGYGKARIREEARRLGLSIWDAPAAPCLSSRVMYGLPVTAARLRQIEEGEAFLRSVGITGDLRVRHRGDEARIEVDPSAFAKVRAERRRIAHHLSSLGFRKVTLDLAGYRGGSLLGPAAAELEDLARDG